MAQILHGRATTTPRTRQAFQQSSESATVLARRFGVSPKTVRKWRRRSTSAPWRLANDKRGYNYLAGVLVASVVLWL